MSLTVITTDGNFPNPSKFYNDAIVYGTESGSYPSGINGDGVFFWLLSLATILMTHLQH